MNRPIKFRAWDRGTKQFLRPWPEGFHILGETTCFDLISQQLKPTTLGQPMLMRLNDVKLTQYTGLKDNNGKEIYEGDIVRVTYDGGYKPTIHQIVWCGDYPAFELQPYLEDESNGLQIVASVQPNGETVEVIGNIFQNSELLEKS